jgi:hypothetical protein
VPGSYADFLKNPLEVVERYLKQTAIRAKIQELQKHEAEIKKLPAKISDFKKRMQASYTEYYNQMVGYARNFLEKNRNNLNPFANLFDYAHLHRLNVLVPWDLFESA